MIDFKGMANKIWSVADLLRGDYKQSDYGKIILPMTVLRRLDCILAPTKQAVLDYLPKVEQFSENVKDVTLNKVAKLNFHNRFWQKMPRSLGNKRKEIPENGNDRGLGFITRIYGDFTDAPFGARTSCPPSLGGQGRLQCC